MVCGLVGAAGLLWGPGTQTAVADKKAFLSLFWLIIILKKKKKMGLKLQVIS
jgi:hypothetical protein